MPACRTLLYLLASAHLLTTSRAETVRRTTIHALCAEADAIVLAHVKEGNQAVVEQWIFPPKNEPNPPAEITISALKEHSRLVESYDSKDAPRPQVPTERFIAFLHRDGPAWRSLGTVTKDEICGSQGLFWVGDEAIYCYLPGDFGFPYWLGPASIAHGDFLSYPDPFEALPNERALFAEIADGLRERRVWEDALADPDPSRRLSRVAAYLIKSTSPSKYHTFIFEADTKALSGMGDPAVAAILGQMERRQKDDDLDAALRGLCDTHGDLRPAVPLLLSLLDHPDSSVGMVLACLSRSEDPRAIPVVKAFASHNSQPSLNELIAEILNTAPVIPERELIRRSPFIANVMFFPAATTSQSADPEKITYQAHLLRNFRGELPKEFLIDLPRDEAANFPKTHHAIAFLRPSAEGKYEPSATPLSWRSTSIGTINWYGGKILSPDEFPEMIARDLAQADQQP